MTTGRTFPQPIDTGNHVANTNATNFDSAEPDAPCKNCGHEYHEGNYCNEMERLPPHINNGEDFEYCDCKQYLPDFTGRKPG